MLSRNLRSESLRALPHPDDGNLVQSCMKLKGALKVILPFSLADSGWLRTKLPLQSGSAFCQAIDDDVKYRNDEHCQ